MARYYVDTSAYLAVLLGEEQGQALAPLLANGELLSSVLLLLEGNRTLIRLSRTGSLTPGQFRAATERLRTDVDSFAIRDLTFDLCSGTLVPVVTTPRSLDLAHLRTALWFHRRQPIDRFLSLDEHQLQGARELELPT